jgi:hypothetical protein
MMASTIMGPASQTPSTVLALLEHFGVPTDAFTVSLDVALNEITSDYLKVSEGHAQAVDCQYSGLI